MTLEELKKQYPVRGTMPLSSEMQVRIAGRFFVVSLQRQLPEEAPDIWRVKVTQTCCNGKKQSNLLMKGRATEASDDCLALAIETAYYAMEPYETSKFFDVEFFKGKHA